MPGKAGSVQCEAHFPARQEHTVHLGKSLRNIHVGQRHVGDHAGELQSIEAQGFAATYKIYSLWERKIGGSNAVMVYVHTNHLVIRGDSERVQGSSRTTTNVENKFHSRQCMQSKAQSATDSAALRTAAQLG